MAWRKTYKELCDPKAARVWATFNRAKQPLLPSVSREDTGLIVLLLEQKRAALWLAFYRFCIDKANAKVDNDPQDIVEDWLAERTDRCYDALTATINHLRKEQTNG